MRYFDKMIRFFRDMKVKKQLIGIYIIVILIPILIIGIYLTHMLCDMVVEKSINEANINIERIKERLNEKIWIATTVAENLYVNDFLETILCTQYKSQQEVIEAYNSVQEITTYLKHYALLNSIRIYTTNKSLLNNSHFIQATDEVQATEWYQEAIERGSQMEWYYKYDEYKKQSFISLIRCLKNRKNEIIGVLVVSLDTNQLSSIIKDEPYDTMIVFNESIVTTSGNSDILSKELTHIREQKKNEEKNFKLKTKSREGEGYIIFTSYSPIKAIHTEIEICMHMSVNQVTEETKKIIAKSLFIILVSMLIASLLIIAFIKRFSERIILVKKEMAKVVAGDFNIVSSISGRDEIGELYEDIYVTVQSVQSLVKEIYEEKVQKEELKRKQKEIQFEMLASQINPHFLYNTLETIRMRALCSGDTELAGIVKMLSKLLRRNLEVSEKRVTIASEIEMMRAYLSIQKFRFGERITYDIQCEVDAEEYKILPLLMQPIIENAFIHGLERKVGSGHINCTLTKVDKDLVIRIEDNGLGLDKEKLNLLRLSLDHPEYKSKVSRVGLRNINERIKLYYGEKYGIQIDSERERGTKVIIILPLIRSGENEGINY